MSRISKMIVHDYDDTDQFINALSDVIHSGEVINVLFADDLTPVVAMVPYELFEELNKLAERNRKGAQHNVHDLVTPIVHAQVIPGNSSDTTQEV